jgi:RHS repeat-associated protein
MFSFLQRFFFFMCFLFLSFQKSVDARDLSPLSIPTPFIQSVNVITGQVDEPAPPNVQYEVYQQGWNQLLDESLFLSHGDFRIGRVKSVHLDLSNNSTSHIHFSYEPGATRVYDAPERESVYRYTKTSLLHALEHYQKDSHGSVHLYRCERLYWQEGDSAPLLISRVLEDGKGQAVLCCCYFYNENDRLIKETLFGNLSGSCQTSCIIGENGYPQANGVESYSTTYLYSEQDPDLLLAQKEDNGLIITYQYESPVQQCTGKLKSYEGGVISRCFYIYDEEGLLKETILDDGKGQNANDRSGVTQRQVISSQGKHQDPLIKPLKNEEEGQKQQARSADAYGNETTYHYDAFERLISIQYPTVLDAWDKPYQPVTTYAYNICDQVIQMIDPRGEKIEISYNIRGKPLKIVYPDGSFESFTYFLDGALKEQIERSGISYSFSRDEACRVICSEKRSPAGNVLQKLHYTYQGELVVAVKDEQTFTTRFLYDEAGRQIGSIQETTDGIRRLEWTYDDCGQKSQVREWFGPSPEDFVVKIEQKDQGQSPQTTLFEDSLGQQTYKIHPIDSTLTPDFVFTQEGTVQNSLGQYVKQEESVDGYGIRHLLTYDAHQRLASLVKYNAMNDKLAETHIRYDPYGNKVLERHHVFVEGHHSRIFTIQWSYDSCKRLLSIMEGEQERIKTTRYHYNAHGQLDNVTKPDGTVLFYTYNDDGLLERFEADDQSFAYRYHYDNLQRLVSIQDLCHDRLQARQYNAFHELIEDQQSLGLTIKHRYDSAGRRIGMILPDHSAIAYYYQGPLLSTVERLGADKKSLYSHGYLYDTKGQLESCRLLDSLGSIGYQYNDQGRLRTIKSPWWSQRIEEDGLDPYGRLLAMEVEDNQGLHSSQFSYTEDGQLAGEEGHQYTYDSLFNRLSDNGQNWQVSALNQLVQTPDTSYLYDVNGNLVEKRSENESIFYSYDALDRLIRVEYPQKQAMEYIYDSFHRRIEESIWEWQEEQKIWHLRASEHFIYDGFKEIGKADGEGRLLELRILGQGQGAEMGAAIALELKGKVFVPLHDLLGSVRCLIDAENGKVVENYRYSAYGQENISNEWGQSIDGSVVGNPWRFCSKRKDDLTGLTFFGKRDYDPEIGRWLTPDPLFFYDNPNLYAFNQNDPLNRRDLYGLFSISQIWDRVADTFFSCFYYLQICAHQAKIKISAELSLPRSISKGLERIGKTLFGESFYLLMGPHHEETYVDCYGQREIDDKVRVTFINGILNTRNMMLKSLEVISESHGGVKVHYVYRPTEGWTWDISRSVMIKTAFALGFRSMHAQLLAQMWKELIQEMGGVEGGGTILHYAHSLGGSETDRARELLSPEEQKMIRVITFGSATLVPNVGYQSVLNNVSVNDGVSSVFLDPIGHIRNYFDPDSNVRFHGSFLGSPYWPTDHLLNGPTYGPVLFQLGEKFLAEFSAT